jgi:hypothetical protein
VSLLNLKVKFILCFLILVTSIYIPFVGATTLNPPYTPEHTEQDWDGSCPDCWPESYSNGHNSIAAHAGGGSRIGYAQSVAFFTPSTTGSYSVTEYFSVNWWLKAYPAGHAWQRVYIRVETLGGVVITDTLVLDKQATNGPNPVIGSLPNTPYTKSGIALTGGQQYRIICRLLANVADSGDVAQDKTIPNHLYLTQIAVSGGGGCPTVYTWDGSQYKIENNLLSSSEKQNMPIDVSEWYVIQNTPNIKDGNVKFTIRETAQDKGYLNQIKLFTINHPTDYGVAVTSSGEIVTYNSPISPINCYLNNIDITNEIATLDKTSYQISSDNYLNLDFGTLTINNSAILLLQTVGRKAPLEIQIKDSLGAWKTIDTILVKFNDSLYASKIEGWLPDINDHYLMRLKITSTNDIDYISISTSSQKPFVIKECSLLNVQYSRTINASNDLQYTDNKHTELFPGDSLSLTFKVPSSLASKNDFIIYTNGYYLNP